MNPTIRILLVLPYRLLLRMWWPLLKVLRRTSVPKKVLVCAESQLMAEHLLPVIDLLRNDSRVEIRLVSPSGIKRSGTTSKQLGEELNLPVLGYAASRFRWWDLILFAEHSGVNQFHPGIKKMLVQHGFDSGKLFHGVDIRYSKDYMYSSANSKMPRYASMLEPSLVTRNKAVASDPLLDGRIAVVGDLGADQMAHLNDQREALRKASGYDPQDIVVLVMGTWQEDSLMETIGEQLVAEAGKLTGKYQFLFSTHPRHWEGGYAESHPWGSFLSEHEREGLAVMRPGDSWEEAAVVSDMAISDHSSVGVKYALLGKPLMYIQRKDGIVSPGTFGARLYDAVPRLEAPSQLEPLLDGIRREYPTGKLNEIAHDINAYPGSAKSHIKEELYRLLDLAPDANN